MSARGASCLEESGGIRAREMLKTEETVEKKNPASAISCGTVYWYDSILIMGYNSYNSADAKLLFMLCLKQDRHCNEKYCRY